MTNPKPPASSSKQGDSSAAGPARSPGAAAGATPDTGAASDFADDPHPWQVVKSDYISRKEWFTVRLDRVRLPNGTEIPEYWVSEFRPWVNVVAVTRADELVLIRQYRHGLGQTHFELPAGTTDAGETDLQAAAQRELLEETGYGGGRWSLLITLSANPALQNNLTYTFLAEDVEPIADAMPEGSEDLRLHLVPVARARALVEEGGFIQALHVAPLLKYLLARAG